ncbi:hypothetical protein GCM10010377_30200 [Streptomyces viridiviolaceus]|nr:hypothetical protein GCM10010377_30200 [Streptomyces viridiviolaceus]
MVLTLTGFSTGRGHGSGGGDGGGGGGCSSSSQNHDSSSSTGGGSYGDHDYDDDEHGSGGGGNGGNSTPSLQDATVELVSCATHEKPYATVEVTNPNTREGTFTVNVDFMDRDDHPADFAYQDVTVPAGATKTAEIEFDAAHLAELDHCEASPEASPAL